MAQQTQSTAVAGHAFVKGVHGVRYQVADVARSVAFYTRHLGFTLDTSSFPRSPASRWVTRRFCSAAPARRARGRCRTGIDRSRAAGTASC